MVPAIDPSDRFLSETDIFNRQARVWCVRATAGLNRPLLAGAPVCPGLAQYRIAHLGATEMPAPFRVVRTRLGGSYFLACFGGEGRVLVDGRWKVCRAGTAFLLPPGTLHAFETPPRKEWHFCWVRYQEERGQRPLAAANSPVLAKFPADSFRHAILGFVDVCRRPLAPALRDSWLALVHSYVCGFAQPRRIDERLWKIWEGVAETLAEPWTSAKMARAAHVSERQFERLCRRDLGRTPRQHVIWLRMRRAAELLATTHDSIEHVATAVGYENPFVFSATFKRFTGFSPSLYPGRKPRSPVRPLK